MGIICNCLRRPDDNDDAVIGDQSNKKNKKIKLLRRICKLCRGISHCKGKVSTATQISLTESTTDVPDLFASSSIAIEEHVTAEAAVVNNLISDLTVTPKVSCSIINEKNVIAEVENNLAYNFPATLYALCANIIKKHVIADCVYVEHQKGGAYVSPVTVLNNYSTKEKVLITYLWINLDPDGKVIGPPPFFLYQAKCKNTYGYGKGITKKVAKRNAAANLLKLLNL